jgi:hypothetical protein
MRPLLFLVLLILAAPFCAAADPQSVSTTGKLLVWNAVTTLDDPAGTPLPEGTQVRYKIRVGPDKDQMTVRAEVSVPQIAIARLNLKPQDVWITIEAEVEGRAGRQTLPVQLAPPGAIMWIQMLQVE